MLVIVLGGGAGVVWWTISSRAFAQRACRESCASNLKQLALATLQYVEDYDGHLPLKPRPEGDWVFSNYGAVRWERPGPGGRFFDVLPTGPLMPYAKNWQLPFCPSDPQCTPLKVAWRPPRHGSYFWNDGLCGKLVDQCKGQPLAWDREPWHNNGRNVAYVDGHVKWLPETRFQ